LPIGISFYTFQTLSYSIDVYCNRMKPVNNIVDFFLYVSFFPQLVAGPIERANYLINQIKKEKIINTKIMDMGVSLILVGLFKKIVIADNLAYYVDDIFANYQNYDGGVLILGLVYFSFQIYCDFSGYSDIAIGTARLFGIELNLNFKFPYHSKNISEFWKRWHISLSTWFRDYVYIPLGGSKNSKPNTYRNLLIVFTLSGLWHGANLTFIFWGLYHVILYYIWIIMKSRFKFNSKIFNLISIIYTYFTVTIGWVFFRSETINDAFNYLKLSIIKLNFPSELRSALVYVLMIILLDIILRNSPKDILSNLRISKRLLFNTIIFILIILFYTEGGNFIYFRF
ncbi:MAG: MBOAT family O-acyltransferase, partial [Candidatus Marisimplicoccus sp.]